MNCKRHGCPNQIPKGMQQWADVEDHTPPLFHRGNPQTRKEAWCPDCYTKFEANKYTLKLTFGKDDKTFGGGIKLSRLPKPEEEIVESAPEAPIEQIAPIEELPASKIDKKVDANSTKAEKVKSEDLKFSSPAKRRGKR